MALLFGAATLLVASRSEAGVRVERTAGAEECPEPAAFAERVKTARDVSVRFTRTGAGYVSVVSTAGGMARRLEDPTCAALADATLVVVKLALEVPAATPEPPARPVAALVPSEVSERPVPAPAPSGGRGAVVELLAGGAVGVGLGSAFAPGGRATASFRFGGWGVGITGLVLAPQSRAMPPGVVDVGVLGGGVEGCRRISPERNWKVGLCSRFELFRLAGSARGFARSEEHARLLPTVGLLLRGQARLAGSFGLFAEAGGTVPLSRERFEIEGAGIVHDPTAVVATAAFGAFVAFE